MRPSPIPRPPPARPPPPPLATRAPLPGRPHLSVAPRASASPSSSTPASSTPASCLTLSVARRVDYGATVKVVGAAPCLGGWDVAAAPAAAWGEGHVWSLALDGDAASLPPGTEYKFVVVAADGGVTWEEGGNRRVGEGGGGAPAAWGAAAGPPSPPPSASPSPSSPPPPPPDLAAGNATWTGPPPTFMTTNERGDRGRGGGGDGASARTWSTDGLPPGPYLAIVSGDAAAPDWLAKLDVVKRVLVDGAAEAGGVAPPDAAVAAATVYLHLINTGALPCAEGGGHTRPNRHARVSMLIFRTLERLLGLPTRGDAGGPSPATRALARRLHARLPSFDAAYTASTPLTRVRDLAHRNDIPGQLKSEIKHTLQNKLHRCAGPEDLVAALALRARLRAGDPAVPPSFLAEYETFVEELRLFFGAADLDALLAGLTPSLDADGASVIDRVLATKAALAGLDATDGGGDSSGAAATPSPSLSSDAARVRLNALADAAHAATGARALLASGLASGLRNDAPDASLAMRQRWRASDARLEDWVFVLLSRLHAAIDPTALAASPPAAWSVPLGALLMGVRNVGLGGAAAPAECFAIENELTAWRAAADADTPDGALRLKASLERALRLAQGVADGVAGALAPAAAALGPPLGAARAAGALPEAEVRASVAFQVAKLAAALLDAARRVAGVPPWDCVVGGEAEGVLTPVPALADAAAALAARPDPTLPAVVLAASVAGDEEVGAAAGDGGAAVAAVLAARSVPHLSHLAIRARQEGLPFAACADGGVVEGATAGLEGAWVRVRVRPDGVRVAACAPPPRPPTAAPSSTAAAACGGTPSVPRPTAPDTSTTAPAPLPSARVHTAGAKAAACGALLRAAGASRSAYGAVPGCVLPFGAMAAAAAGAGEAAALAAALAAVDAAPDGAHLDAACSAARAVVERLRPDAAALTAAVAATTGGADLLAVRSSASAEDLAGASAAGLYDSVLGVPAADPAAVGAAVATVWASLFTRRAVLARRAAGAPSAGDAAMAVILQAAAPAALSFVLHTAHPERGPGWVAAEVAAGAGEALASAADGTAWRLAIRKRAADASTDGDSDGDAGAVVTEAYANLSRALVPSSTANGGAGLAWRPVDYSRERLSVDPAARTTLGVALARVAVALEGALGGAQDVEGCVSGEGDVVVVQSRPQPGA